MNTGELVAKPELALDLPAIFPGDRIIAGVTRRNEALFPDRGGLSLSPGKILTKNELLDHRQALAAQLGLKTEQLKFQNQVHGATVRLVHKDSRNEESDGMVTNEKGIVLCAIIADCAAILLYDPVCGAVGALHSGWRGTKENIAARGIELMQESFGSRASDLLAYVSPCASGRSYIVREDVAAFFPWASKKISEEEYLLDIRARIREELHEAGLPESNIEMSQECTIANPDYHSYRRDGERSGRMAAFIGLK